MRLLVLLALLFAFANAVYVPPHVPVGEVVPGATYQVPYWLGMLISTTNQPSTWTLPLVYFDNGTTPSGTTLIVQNNGPYDITLVPTTPETIAGTSSYLIASGSTVSLLSSVDWIVTGAGAGTAAVQNQIVDCWLSVGNTNPLNKQCGDATMSRAMIGDDALFGTDSRYESKFLVKGHLVDPGVSVGNLYLASFNATVTAPSDMIAYTGLVAQNYYPANLTASYGFTKSAVSFNSLIVSPSFTTSSSIVGATAIGCTIGGSASGSIQFCRGVSSQGVSLSSVYPQTANTGGNIVNSFGFIAPVTVSPTNWTITNNYGFVGNGQTTGSTNNANFVALGGSSGGSGVNAAFWASSNVDNDGSGFVAGITGVVAMRRCDVNTWCDKIDAGALVHRRISGSISVGSITTPSNTNAGAITTTISSPTLQAFGAVTANAASGLLSFTVSTAAVTCASAVVTNTNVVAGSEVILTIQSYTGTRYTNGIPAIYRSDTSGSSSGSFTLTLCNDHATNALSGNLFVAFWVLN